MDLMHLMSIIKLEFRYMGIQSFGAGLALCVLLFLLARNQDPDIAWTLSSLIPIGALIPADIFEAKMEAAMQFDSLKPE